jgi:hypothetical protein
MYRTRQGVARGMVVASAVVVLSAVLPFAATADPIDDQRAEVERITDELAALEEQADILAEEYVQAIDKEKRLNAEVAAAEKRVAAKQAAVAELRGELGEMAVRSFIGAGSNGLGPMFTASSDFTADLQRDHLSRVALSTSRRHSRTSATRRPRSPKRSPRPERRPRSSTPSTRRPAPRPRRSSAT